MTKGKKDPGKPRTGTGDAARGRKPQANECRMVGTPPEGGIRAKQPKGWGIAKVIDIVTGKEKK